MEMMNEFAKVCVAFGESMELYNRTMGVYDFLKAHKGERFSPTEIAEQLGYAYTWSSGHSEVQKDRVVKPLHWLLEMGLVKREEYKITIILESYGWGHYETRTKIIDGIEYTARVHVDGDYEKEVSMYKWYVE